MRHKTLRSMRDPRGGEYKTRRLLPGDVFELPDNKQGRLISRVLRARKWAAPLRDEADVPPPPPEVARKIADALGGMPPLPPTPYTEADVVSVAVPVIDDLAAARTEYEAALGKKPFYGWDSATLREKIAAAQTSA